MYVGSLLQPDLAPMKLTFSRQVDHDRHLQLPSSTRTDTGFLLSNWQGYLKAMTYVYNKVQPSGLLSVTGTRDWARWQTGFNMSEAQMILYRTLTTGASPSTGPAVTRRGSRAAWTSERPLDQKATLGGATTRRSARSRTMPRRRHCTRRRNSMAICSG